jgi:hypothetical protein
LIVEEEKKETMEVKGESEDCGFKRSRFNTPLKRRPNTALQAEPLLTEQSPAGQTGRMEDQLYASEILPGIMSSEIPGIFFKRSSSKREGSWKEVEISGGVSLLESSSYTSRSSRMQEQWEAKRKINIDAIISRKCKNYDEMMAEYYRRSGIPPGSKLFLFDSQDAWLKKYPSPHPGPSSNAAGSRTPTSPPAPTTSSGPTASPATLCSRSRKSTPTPTATASPPRPTCRSY